MQNTPIFVIIPTAAACTTKAAAIAHSDKIFELDLENDHVIIVKSSENNIRV